MKLLAVMATLWGLAWYGYGMVNYGDSDAFAAGATMLVILIWGFVSLATVRSASQLSRRLLLLWVLAVIAMFWQFALQGSGGPLVVGAALLFGTVAFALWMGPPLVAFALIRQLSPDLAMAWQRRRSSGDR